MSLIQVDMDKCVSCGACSDVCLTKAIILGGSGPEAVDDACIRCGHCVAVCPTAALTHTNAPLEEQTRKTKTPALTPEAVAQYMRSRVSVRTYRDKKVPREEVEKVLNIARFAPTHRNSQAITYLVIDDASILRQVREAAISLFEHDIERGIAMDGEYDPSYPKLKLSMVSRFREQDTDTILWGAPCLVLALADKSTALNPREASIYCLTYAHLYAPSLGLGSCWAGAVEYGVVRQWEPMLKALDVGDDFDKITAALMLGYPKYRYPRLVSRDPLSVKWK